MTRTKNFLTILALAVFAPLLSAQTPVSDLSVWRPSKTILASIRTTCGAGNPADLESCFLTQMKNQGASNDAIAFSQSMSSTGQLYLNFFRKTGRVSVGYFTYVFRANDLNGVVLLNGSPSPINVDDPQYLTAATLAQNPVFQQLTTQHPNLMSFPSDRTNTIYPEIRDQSAGGQQALVRYLLKDCHACATVATARVAFNFDASGKFTGAVLKAVIPGGPPSTESPVESSPAGDSAGKGTAHTPGPHPSARIVTTSYQQAPSAQAQSSNEAAAHGGAMQQPPTDTNATPTAITTTVGKTFTISLEGNRTTGYSWKLATKLDPKLVRKVSQSYSATNPGLAGSGGIDKFTFRATGKGTATLTFTYSRPWEKNAPPATTATYTLTIN
jgi:predicted secreted protein